MPIADDTFLTDHAPACLCEDCHSTRMAKARATPVDPIETMPEWISKTLSYPDGDVHQVRLFISGDAWLVVEEVRRRISTRVGRPIPLGQALELLAAEYLAT